MNHSRLDCNSSRRSREPGTVDLFQQVPTPSAHFVAASTRMSSFLNHRPTQNSPSVTMEKGAYRIRRGPLLRNPENITFPSTKRSPRIEDISATGPTARTESQAISASLISQEKRLALVIIFLVVATFCCFGTAYYLFTMSR